MIAPSGMSTALRRAVARQCMFKPQDWVMVLIRVALLGERMPYVALPNSRTGLYSRSTLPSDA